MAFIALVFVKLKRRKFQIEEQEHGNNRCLRLVYLRQATCAYILYTPLAIYTYTWVSCLLVHPHGNPTAPICERVALRVPRFRFNRSYLYAILISPMQGYSRTANRRHGQERQPESRQGGADR